MNYLSPYIKKMSQLKSKKSLAKKGISCGIFQDLNEDSTSPEDINKLQVLIYK